MGEPTVVILHNEGGEHNSEDTEQSEFGDIALPNMWEEPLRTLGVYLGALGVLFAMHYLPFTRWALKTAMTTLGVVSVTEFASRSFSSNSLSRRLRPRQYRTVDEATLNATLKDVHDLIQSGAIQAQKILYGQDLEKAFGAFIGVTALYVLAQVVAPFWMAVMALTSIFIAPLVNSPQGRKAAKDASARAQDLANTTAEKGRELAKNGQAKASELSSDLSSKAQRAADDVGNTVSSTAQNGKQAAADAARNTSQAVSNAAQNGKQTAVDMTSKAKDTAADLSGSAADTARNAGQAVSNTAQNGKQTAADLSSKAQDAASDLSGSVADSARNAGTKASNAAQNGKQTAADLSSQATDKAANTSGYAADNLKNLPSAGSNAVNNAQGILSSAFGDAERDSNHSSNQHYTYDSGYNSSHKGSRDPRSDHPRGHGEYETDRLASRASHSTNVGAEPPRLSAADDVNSRAT
ncbi:hypothetical protein CSUB01_09036 [Colletotrichum sublineola]|uniref:Reticulon domain-containing protein n=1 Tax=Colletotrichum sublineola TaxID=1173701 RepID=A0A066WVJ7_COLSU|nr:hypothetical protein CSUB01_09036 [Colletotrichum sublineola]